jgi:myosin-5
MALNANMFNCLLIHRQSCALSNGEYMRAGLKEVEAWIHQAGEDEVSVFTNIYHHTG